MAGVSQPSPLAAAQHHAQALAATGDLTGAELTLQYALEGGRVDLGEDDPAVLAIAHQLATVYRQSGDPSAARRVLEETFAAGRWKLGDADPLMLSISFDLGIVAEELGNRHEARKAFGRVAELGPPVLGDDHWAVRRAQTYLHANGDTATGGTAPTSPAPGDTTPDSTAPGSEVTSNTIEAGNAAGADGTRADAPDLQRSPPLQGGPPEGSSDVPTTAPEGWPMTPAQRAEAGPTQRTTTGPALPTPAEPAPTRPVQPTPTGPVQAAPTEPLWPIPADPARRTPAAQLPAQQAAEGELVGRSAALTPHSAAPPTFPLTGVHFPEPRERSRGRGPMILAAIAAMVAALAAVAALVLVLVVPKTEKAPQRPVEDRPPGAPTLGGGRAPEDVRLQDSGSTVELSWTDPTTGSVSFLVTGGHPGELLKPMGQIGPGRTSLKLQGLNSGLDYCFAVVAVYSISEFSSSPQVCTNRSGAKPQPSATA